MKEKEIAGASAAQTDPAQEATRLEKLRKSLGPKFFKAYQSGLNRFDELYRLLAK